MADLEAKIDKLTDVQVIAAIKQLNRSVFSAVPFDSVKAATAATSLTKLPESVAAAKLDSASAVAASRQLLHAFAKDSAIAPLAEEVVDDVQKDDALFIETAIVLGVLVNLTMFMASSEMTFQTKRFKIEKGKVSTDLVKAIVAPIEQLIKKLPGVP